MKGLRLFSFAGAAAIVAALCISVGCSSKKEMQTSVAPAGITLSALEKTLEVGESFLLTASVLPSNAENKSVSWSSTNAAKVTVDESGLVTALAQGNAYVVAETTNALKASCLVTVSAPAAYHVAINQDGAEVTDALYGWPGRQVQLSASSDDGNPHAYSWSSSVEGISVQDGLVSFGLGAANGAPGYAWYTESVVRASTVDGYGASIRAITSIGEDFLFGAASQKVGADVAILAGKSAEISLFSFDGTALVKLPGDAFVLKSGDSHLLTVDGNTLTASSDAVGSTVLHVVLAGSENRLCTVFVEKDGSNESGLETWTEETPDW